MTSTQVPIHVRRARWAVSAMFLTNGALIANILPRYPEIKTALGLDDLVYGVALAMYPTGSIVAGLGAAWLIRLAGSARVATIGTVIMALLVLGAGVSPTLGIFAAALFLAGACDAIVDVGQNAHGLRVQRSFGRSILNSLHAIWSIGAVLGGSLAALAIWLRVPLGMHLAVSGALFAIVALVALRFALPGRDVEPTETGGHPVVAGARLGRMRVVAVLAALTLLGAAGSVVEDSGNSWAALYLGESLGAPAALAAAGYIALVAAQFVGRILGDGLVDRFGHRAVAAWGGAIIAVGMGLALAFPTVPGTIAGFALAGYGCATLVPAAMEEADRIPGLRAGTGLTIVSWLMRLGFLVAPPVVGATSEATTLRIALLIVPAAGLTAIACAWALRGRRPARMAG